MSSDPNRSSRESRSAEADRADRESDGPRERRATPDEHAASTERSVDGEGATVANAERRQQSSTGESIGRQLDSAQATLTRSGPKSQLTLLLGLFGVVGLGIGVSGSILVGAIGGSGFAAQLTSGLLSMAAVVTTLFLGIALAAIGGLRVATDLDGDRETYLTSFVGNTVGYVVMNVVAIVLLGTPADTGFGSLLLSLVVLGLIAGAVGCATSALHRRAIGRVA